MIGPKWLLAFGFLLSAGPARAQLGGNAIPAPTAGAYFGAWANPTGTGSVETDTEALEAQIHRGLALHMHYFPWSGATSSKPSFPESTMHADYAHGRIPVVTWHCGDLNSVVVAGQYDMLLDNVATAIKQFPGPIFLRWYWEMNLAAGANNQSCMDASGPYAGAAGYVAAWQHIWNRLVNVDHVTNVAWLWNPAGAAADPSSAPFYPGDAYVDWIGFDGYDKVTANDFGPIFNTFYQDFSYHNKPFLIAETGECPGEQQIYLGSAQAEIEGASNSGKYSFPLVGGFMYFDAIGGWGKNHPACPQWSFDVAGFNGFETMGSDPYFATGTDVVFRDGFEF